MEEQVWSDFPLIMYEDMGILSLYLPFHVSPKP